MKGLSYSESRGFEHLVYEANGGVKNPKLLNKIRPINVDNPKVAKKATKYIDDALEFLKKAL